MIRNLKVLFVAAMAVAAFSAVAASAAHAKPRYSHLILRVDLPL